jgi:hypothetical protein
MEVREVQKEKKGVHDTHQIHGTIMSASTSGHGYTPHISIGIPYMVRGARTTWYSMVLHSNGETKRITKLHERTNGINQWNWKKGGNNKETKGKTAGGENETLNKNRHGFGSYFQLNGK